VSQVYKDIEYTVYRSRRRTSTVFIEADGSISVLVPEKVTDAEVEVLLEQRRKWIYRSLAEWREKNDASDRPDFVDGEELMYLGRAYPLKLVDQADEPLALKDGYFQLRRQAEKHPIIEPIVKAFYREKGTSRIPPRVEHFERQLQVKSTRIVVMELQNRWTELAADGGLVFHWKCMTVPLEIIDYMIVHLLARLQTMQDDRSRDSKPEPTSQVDAAEGAEELASAEQPPSDALMTEALVGFWAQIERVMPDYKERGEWLSENGIGMKL